MRIRNILIICSHLYSLSGANFTCACGPGLGGPTCEAEVDECLSGPCANGATCTDLRADYSCACAPGFTGKSCEVDMNECESSPCQHGACSDLVGAFSQGFFGLKYHIE